MNIKSLQPKIQRFGSSLSSMVMPNIGIFIGWGLIAALFIDTGWLPNKYLGELVGPILKYLLPVLIGYTGGYNVYSRRGAVVGAFATMGVVIGAEMTMLVGGMIMGPLSAYILKKFDQAIESKVKPGLEMIVDNFSLGIIGMIICILGYIGVAPVMTSIQNVLASGVNYMMQKHLLPLVSIFIAPGQVLFLNNVINHGIMIPIGLEQVAEFGKSILFLVEANGGNWVGLTLAFAIFGQGLSKKSAPGATLIMFLGGIAEVCFPYALSLPLTILGPIAGCAFSMTVLSLFGGGTVGPVSPGSVIAYFAMTPKDSIFVNGVAYFGSLIVSFIVTSIILKLFSKNEDNAELNDDLNNSSSAIQKNNLDLSQVRKVVFACDAGMGSSVMGASILKKKAKELGLDVIIVNSAIDQIPNDADMVISHKDLTQRAIDKFPNAIHFSVENFMQSSEYDDILLKLKNAQTNNTLETTSMQNAQNSTGINENVLIKKNILLNQSFKNKEEVIIKAFEMLKESGYVGEGYLQGMLDREEISETHFGIGLAIPHGTFESKSEIKKSGIAIIAVPEGLMWDDEVVKLIIAIAGKGDNHLSILANIANNINTEEIVNKLACRSSVDEIYNIITRGE